MRNWLMAVAVTVGLSFGAWGAAQAAGGKMHPFVLASEGPGEQAAVAAEVKDKLTAAGFEIAGAYDPYPGATVIAVTNDALRQAAAKSEHGGYGASQRVAVTARGNAIQVSYTNPAYMAAAYRMKDDLADASQRLEKALGRSQEFGAEDEAMTDAELRKYHYTFGMEYFDEPSELNTFASHAEAVDRIEKALAERTSGISKVYRIDIPGKEEVVFGVGMVGSEGGGEMQDDAYIMNQIDFKDLRSTAHLPYEVLVSGKTAYSLYARFRIAINFPDLSMMGDNSFMSIMGSPDAIEKALIQVAGGKIEKPKAATSDR